VSAQPLRRAGRLFEGFPECWYLWAADEARSVGDSQNWTGAGTKPNRDASLLVESHEAAQYFTDIFEFDCAKTDRVPPDHGPTRRARGRRGMRRRLFLPASASYLGAPGPGRDNLRPRAG
jgi:hypothetical protein